jgi:hypothetical protein
LPCLSRRRKKRLPLWLRESIVKKQLVLKQKI